MKYLKYLFLTIFTLIILSLLAVIYDLSYYDPSYVNRSAITFSKKNINSKKIKKIYSSIEKIPYILGNQFLDSHKRFWEVEDENKRNSLPSTIVIPAKKEKESLSKVLDELKPYNYKIVVVLEKEDYETIESIQDRECKILFQKKMGYGDALIQGINFIETELFCIFNEE